MDVHLLYSWNDGGGANTINSGTEFLTEWMSGTEAGKLEQGLLNYIQSQSVAALSQVKPQTEKMVLVKAVFGREIPHPTKAGEKKPTTPNRRCASLSASGTPGRNTRVRDTTLVTRS